MTMNNNLMNKNLTEVDSSNAKNDKHNHVLTLTVFSHINFSLNMFCTIIVIQNMYKKKLKELDIFSVKNMFIHFNS